VLQRYRLAYILLFALAGVAVAASVVLGELPAVSYLKISLSGRSFVIWVLPALIWYGLLAIAITRRRVDHPVRTMLRVTRFNRHWLLRGMVFAFLALPLGRALTAIKVAIPTVVPFYADPVLAELDKALFFVDPWRLTHAVIGEWGTIAIDRIYALWFLVMMGMIAWAAFTRDQKFQIRALLSIYGTWIVLGNLIAVSLSSVGPCFYEHFYGDRRFAPLMAILGEYDQNIGVNALFAMRYLLRVYGQESIGSGISAMPSVHVGIAFLFWLICRHRFRRKTMHRLAAAFFATIFVGSVHLGWHYAVDGIVSVIGVALIWWGSGRFVDWVGAREARSARAKPKPRARGPNRAGACLRYLGLSRANASTSMAPAARTISQASVPSAR
jgi:hypothetical protein